MNTDNDTKKSYILRHTNEGELQLIDGNGLQVPISTLLNTFPSARVYALDGAMGAGKTTLLKQLCREMGTTDMVNSPTFAIINVYSVDEGKYAGEIYHFDCYRLNGLNEAQEIGAEDYLYSGNYCFVEWPDVLLPMLPEDTVWIKLSVLPSGDRQLTITAN